jgi:hypothetical protein
MGRRGDGAGINVQHKPEDGFDDTPVPVRMKLSLLWVSTMLEGRIGPLGVVTQSVLLGTSVLMAIPSLMVFLSIALSPTLSRLANIVFGIIYSIIMLLVVLYPAWVFYRFFGILEIALTLLIVWYAWTWPKRIRRKTQS